jgi:hypothetical protein
MFAPSPQPVDSFENLRSRVERLLRAREGRETNHFSLPLAAEAPDTAGNDIVHPTKSIGEFLDFLADSIPLGEVYLFGGILRDLALLGRRGFNSDVDLVVEGHWSHCVAYLESLGAMQNKFGGFRLPVAGWSVDIWNAQETWAIRNGCVEYRGIASLTETTVLNWDAILMDWRTKRFVSRPGYLREIHERILDVVLMQNPNPLGMAVRVFRHLCLKDAKKITSRGAAYLADATEKYTFDLIRSEEIRSYGKSVIQKPIYDLFHLAMLEEGVSIGERYGIATEALRRELNL